MGALERENARALERTGEITEAATAAYAELKKTYETLTKGVNALSEALRVPMPALPAMEAKEKESQGKVALQRGVDGADGSGGVNWDDEESKLFYEDLPDLRAIVPAALLPREVASVDGGGGGGEGDAAASASGAAAAAADGFVSEKRKADDAAEDAAAGAQHAAKVDAYSFDSRSAS